MAFDQALLRRIASLDRMSKEDWEDLFLHLAQENTATETEATQNMKLVYQMRLHFDLLYSLDRMDATSSKLAKLLVWMTGVLIVLTVLLLFTAPIFEPYIKLLLPKV